MRSQGTFILTSILIAASFRVAVADFRVTPPSRSSENSKEQPVPIRPMEFPGFGLSYTPAPQAPTTQLPNVTLTLSDPKPMDTLLFEKPLESEKTKVDRLLRMGAEFNREYSGDHFYTPSNLFGIKEKSQREIDEKKYRDEYELEKIRWISDRILLDSFKREGYDDGGAASRARYEGLVKEFEAFKLNSSNDDYFIKTFKEYVGREPLNSEKNAIDRFGAKSAVSHDIRYSDAGMKEFFRQQTQLKCATENPVFLDSLKSTSEWNRRYESFRKLGLCRADVVDNYSCQQLIKALNTEITASASAMTCEEKDFVVSRIGAEAKPYTVPTRICGHFARDFHEYCLTHHKECRTIVIRGKPNHTMNLIKMTDQKWHALESQNGTISKGGLEDEDDFKEAANMPLINEARGLGNGKIPGLTVHQIYKKPIHPDKLFANWGPFFDLHKN